MKGQIIQVSLILCLAVFWITASEASGCSKSRRYKNDKVRAGETLIEEDNYEKCLSHINQKYKELPDKCCSLGLCGLKDMTKLTGGAKHSARSLAGNVSIPSIIAKLIRCILNIFGQDEQHFNTLGCCSLVPYPFWCTR